jgi:hypothetical protein
MDVVGLAGGYQKKINTLILMDKLRAGGWISITDPSAIHHRSPARGGWANTGTFCSTIRLT